MNIIDYAMKVKNNTFAEEGINTLDVAIFTEVNYLVFKDFLTDSFQVKDGLSMKEIAKRYQVGKEGKHEQEVKFAYDKRVELLHLMADSKRYQDIQAFAHQDVFDEENEIQFSATAFAINDQILVVYRGTDNSLIGWKEDFNLSYMTIPSQKLALDYLNQLSQFHQHLILAGHSKGGNLALYAGVLADKQEQIEQIYAFDAPGLQEELLERQGYQKLVDANRIQLFSPQSSFVGVLFDNAVETTYVKSDGLGLMQHLLLLWQVDLINYRFKLAKKRSTSSLRMQALSSQYLNDSEAHENKGYG